MLNITVKAEHFLRGDKQMTEAKIVIKNSVGLHARPAVMVVTEASKFKSQIFFVKDNKEYDAKSIMNILAMGASQGDEIIIKAEGPDEKEAVNTLITLINGFTE